MVSGPATISGNTVTLNGVAGTVVIAAIQPGTVQYIAAPQVTRSFDVIIATRTISFASLDDKLTTDVPFSIEAEASSGLPITFSIIAGPASIAGNIITLTGEPGEVTVRASQPGNGQYAAAPDKTRAFDVEQVNRITFGSLADKFTTDAPFQLTASANSGLPIVYTVVSGPATVLDNIVTLDGVVGTVEIKASQVQPGNTQYNAASDKYRSFEVIHTAQIITFGTLADKITTDAPFAITATASSALPVTFALVSGPATLVGNTITLTGVVGTVVLKAQQNGNNTYSPATAVEQSFEVTHASQSIVFEAITSKTTVDAPFNVVATASSGLPVSYSIVSGPATISGNTITLNGEVGTVTVKAEQNGNNTYGAATPAILNFEVLLASQAILFEPLSDKFTDDIPFQLEATCSSGLPVTFTLISGPAILSDNTLITLAGIPGTVVIAANQGGNNQYLPAIEVIRSFEVFCITADTDNDGVCAGIDCNDFDPLLALGTTCDDGDPLTGNDEIQSDGCTCAGTVSTTNIIEEYGIMVSPNPTSHTFQVRSNERFYRAQLMSVTGVLAWQQAYQVGSTAENIDINTLAIGTYMLMLDYKDGKRAVVKVVKSN